MENYEINLKTMAIIPINKNKTKIIEEEEELIINNSAFKIIDHSCKYFGSSYEGRHHGTIEMTGISYKTPIIIEESKKIIFFPTMNAKADDCIWISLDKIEKFYKKDYITKLIFKNGYELNLDISLGSLQNQILRSSLLDSKIRKRIEIS